MSECCRLGVFPSLHQPLGEREFAPDSSRLAIRPPSTSDSNFAQRMDSVPTRVPSPQSTPAMTFSRPTTLAYLRMRSRSEERRVGKECRSGWETYDSKK